MADTFGTRLRDMRRAAGLSQRGLASHAGLDFSYISKLENGRLPPPAADTIVIISNILGVPAEGLLALVGKLPSDVQQTVGTSEAAQTFLRETHQMMLTDDEWDRMSTVLKGLRGKRG